MSVASGEGNGEIRGTGSKGVHDVGLVHIREKPAVSGGIPGTGGKETKYQPSASPITFVQHSTSHGLGVVNFSVSEVVNFSIDEHSPGYVQLPGLRPRPHWSSRRRTGEAALWPSLAHALAGESRR